jgi:cholesterol transport system auxiliary component
MRLDSPIFVRAGALLAALALATALGGCSLTRPAPVKNTFLLDPRLPPPAAAPKAVTLRIGTINVAAPYRDRAFVYRTGELQFETDFYYEFLVAPGAMIAQATARALDRANIATRVVPSGTAPEEGDFVLEAFVSDLYADARQKPAAAVVGITFYLTKTTFPSSVVWSRAYAERVALPQSAPDALASAWNEALSRILESLARDLAAAGLSPA